MKIFPCGCSLTRDSWALCREHFDAKEGRLAAFYDELERLEASEGRLIEVCESLQFGVDDYWASTEEGIATLALLRAALAKATGETP